MITAASSDPFGIYVHVPFCEQKCAYCDFFTVTDPDRTHPLYGNWLDLCARELALWLQKFPHLTARPLASIFFGGGTPSLLPPGQFREFLATVRQHLPLAADLEVTLETQPGTLDEFAYSEMVNAGINRFSIGAQTFNPRLLQPTARRHTVEETALALERAKATGAVVSLDMICALPGQTLPEWQNDLEHAISFHPHHISVYEMTYHAGTQYFRQWKRGQISEADEDTRVEMFQHTRRRLPQTGYVQYEISNYARLGYESRHNRLYWTLSDFVGLGAGAHSYVQHHRYANPRSASAYAAAIQEDRLFAQLGDSDDPDITLVENLTMALRLLEGVNLDWLATRLGEDVRQTRAPQLRRLQLARLVNLSDDHLQLTEAGILQADSVAEAMLAG